MRFKLWGTRGSIPSPLRSDDIKAKLEAAFLAATEAAVDLRDPMAMRAFISSLPFYIRGTAGGDTACLEVRSAGNLLIFDCGSGLRRLGLELMQQEFARGQGIAHIFMTHTHWDHMMGWPFFVPGFIPGNQLFIYGVHPDLENRFKLQQTAPYMFPISIDEQPANIEFVTIQEGETVKIGQTRIRNIRFTHAGKSYGYRIEDEDGILVYATDSEYKTLDPVATQHIVEFFRNADALIFDAMFSLTDSYRFEDWGHSSPTAGADLATRAGAHRLLLFHHDPRHTDEQIWGLRDIAEEYRKQHPSRPPCEVIVAYDGFEMELWREARLEVRSEHVAEGIVIHLSGRLVEETASTILTAVRNVTTQDGHPPLVIDLQEVTYLDPMGLKALFLARRLCRPLALAGLSSELRRTFIKLSALDYFAVFDTPDEALSTLEETTQLRVGRLLSDRYKIDEQLNRGPFGDLYLATDQVARRQVTVLVTCPSLGPVPTEALIEAAQTNFELRHPLIADTFDTDQDGKIRYVVMEYTRGRSIHQILRSPRTERSPATRPSESAAGGDAPTPISASRAMHICSHITKALDYAHGQNIIHGALNPENVIVLDDGSIKLIHFGIGRPGLDRPMSELPAWMGPLSYLAPEQLQGYGNRPASDLYALGTILYEMLTGHLPFGVTDNDQDLIDLKLHQQPVPPRRHMVSLSRSLEHFVLNLLHRSPQRRYTEASVVRRMLTNLDPQLRKSPLLGRESLTQKLRQHLERVAQGQSGTLVVRGQKGIGKSRMVLSVADQWATEQPLTSMYSELYAYEGNSSFRLFLRALRPTLLNLPAHQLSGLLDDLGDLSDPLIALLPQLRPTLSALAPAETSCDRLEEAICETHRLLAARRMVLLILDSLQWIDAASLRLLEQLVQQRIPNLLIVALHRTEEIDSDHPLHHTLSALEPWIDELLDVTGLEPIDVYQMTAPLNTQVPPDFGLWLYGETEGNPFHTEQLIHSHLEGPGETGSAHERTTTGILDDVILRRLERLADDTLLMLRQAAILGHSFHIDQLRAALDRPEGHVLASLDDALHAGLVFGHVSEDLYSFSHPLIREVLYADMLTGVRTRFHWQAARVLERGGVASTLDAKIDTLAFHFLNSGESEKALAYLARASRRSQRLCAYDVALDYINQALALVDQLSRRAVSQKEHEQRRKQRNDLLAARARLEMTAAQ